MTWLPCSPRLGSIVVAHAADNHNLNLAIESRNHTGQAQGILMIKYGLDTVAAFEVMKRYSQHYNVKLQVVASHIIQHGSVPDAAESPGHTTWFDA